MNTYQEILKNELAEKEKNLALLLDSVANDKAALIAKSRDTFIRLLNATPNGVIRNSDVAKGVVETSLNVGVVTMTDNNVEIHCLIRSLIDSGKDYVVSMLDSLGKLAGAKTEAKGAYPGWQPDANSPVMHLVRETLSASVQQNAEHPDYPRGPGMWSVQKTVSGNGHGFYRANYHRSTLSG